ncbi:MAG: hypothetical protein LUJ09_05465, partial [Firmicutes bacterium]|nr:hypothetical protein [Bacillota bacterium]
IDGYYPSWVLADQQLLLYDKLLDGTDRGGCFLPFSFQDLTVDTQARIYLPVTSAQPGNRGLFLRDGMMYTWASTTSDGGTATVYDLQTGTVLAQWDAKGTHGYSNTQDAVLLLQTDATNVYRQRIYQKNLLDGTETDLLLWEITDTSVQPTLYGLSQGENGFAFYGGVYDDKTFQYCCGFLDYDGNLECLTFYGNEYKFELYPGGLLVRGQDFGVFAEEQPEDLYQIYDADTLSFRTIPDLDGSADAVTISDHGKYMIVNQLSNGELTYWVYDLRQAELMETFQYTPAYTDIYQYIVSISEEQNGFLLMLRRETLESALIYFAF